MTDRITLRKSAIPQTVIDYIDSRLKEDKNTTQTGIIVDLLAKAVSHSGQEGATPSQIPTGIIIECPMRPTTVPICWCSNCFNTVYMKQQVDSSVCKTCPKYPCEPWEDIFAQKRMDPENPMIQKIQQHHDLRKGMKVA